MSLKHGLLGLLNYGAMTGYELDKAFKESLNFFWQAGRSQIYRELNTMEKLGWLSSEIIFQADKPNKKVYSLTEEGRLEFQNWLSLDCIDEALCVRSVFLMKTFFSGEKDTADNIQMLINYKEKCRNALLNLEKTNNSIDNYKDCITDKKKSLYWGSTAGFGKYYFEMCIRWAEDTIKLLEEEKV